MNARPSLLDPRHRPSTAYTSSATVSRNCTPTSAPTQPSREAEGGRARKRTQ
jgi:hypothetical protein